MDVTEEIVDRERIVRERDHEFGGNELLCMTEQVLYHSKRTGKAGYIEF